MMAVANGFAVAGLPHLVEMLKDGDAEPIWNLSEEIEVLMRAGIRPSAEPDQAPTADR